MQAPKRLLRRFGGLRRVILFGFCLLAVALTLRTLAVSNSRVVTDVSSAVAAPPDAPVAAVSSAAKSEQLKENVAAVPPGAHTLCDVGRTCGEDELSMSVEASLAETALSSACINDLKIFDKEKLAKGLNVIVLDENTRSVQDIKYFDVLGGDREFVGFMSHIPAQRVIVVASYGDIAEKISTESRELLQKFGSKKIFDFRRGNTFVLVGQRGLEGGQATEEVGQLSEKDTEAKSRVARCFRFPLGKIDTSVQLLPARESGNSGNEAPNAGGSVSRRESITYGQELPHCGAKDPCPTGQIAFSFFSGKNKDDNPRICVNGRFVIDRNLNKAGRGLNIVVLNAATNDILRVGHFDTYASDSSTLEIFLEQMIKGEMIAVVSFDEAATRLSSMAKQMFYELGSGLVQNIKFRASWYFIGQKGISGFTPFEELNFPSGNEWAKSIDNKICVPHTLDGRKTVPDPIIRKQNDAKRHFCEKFDGYEEFCDDIRLDDVLVPTPLANKSRENDPIFKAPIMIAAGLSHNALRMCLETVLKQEGLDPKMVLVAYDEIYSEAGALSQLFGFRSIAINATSSYADQLAQSIDHLWVAFPEAEVAIVIEEELLLTSDFLYYMSQLLPVFKQDDSLGTVSAWNNNGFAETSSLPAEVYRVEKGLPGLGFMLKRTVYEKHMRGRMSKCCSRRAWDQWDIADNLAMIVPDLSRVLRRHADALGVVDELVEQLFHRERVYSKDPLTTLRRPDRL
uniref:ILEI/PANDER domain-containing protein n=1 Tax=Plectus sambesii TaxID=2011161 RepID=A0A914X295_9BILA